MRTDYYKYYFSVLGSLTAEKPGKTDNKQHKYRNRKEGIVIGATKPGIVCKGSASVQYGKIDMIIGRKENDISHGKYRINYHKAPCSDFVEMYQLCDMYHKTKQIAVNCYNSGSTGQKKDSFVGEHSHKAEAVTPH